MFIFNEEQGESEIFFLKSVFNPDKNNFTIIVRMNFTLLSYFHVIKLFVFKIKAQRY